MSVDVSLCVVRLEKSDTDGDLTEGKLPSSISVFRGRRQLCDILIETYVPEMSEETEIAGAIVRPSAEIVSPRTNKDSIQFVSGNPFVEKTHGIIHLFKEDELTSIERASRRSQTVCILAVPSTMTCSDLLTFIAACHDDIKHVRIIRDSSPNQYMALVTFRTPKSVEEFYSSFNGIPFNSLEPECCCHLVFVSKVETVSESDGGCIAPVSHTELPTCPVCLERMDESVDGILTIMCNHAFHTNCLTKWGDSTCPVCRYVQTPEPVEENFCLECLSKESLWICLICGHVGCGRYVQGHAYRHYTNTNHCYSMQLGSNSVWDYVGDNFVHRILQNKADGKLVEGPTLDKANSASKLEAVQLEYTYLLTSQLESQRIYYEEMMSDVERSANDSIALLSTKFDELKANYERLSEECKGVAKDKTQLEKKVQSLTSKLTNLQTLLDEERDLNKAMRNNQTTMTDLLASKDKELVDVKEQLRDVMFFLEAEKVINNSDVSKDELKDAKIEVGEPSSAKPHRRRKHK